MNCCVTETKDTALYIQALDDLREVGQRPGESVHLVDDDDIDLTTLDGSQQRPQSGPVPCCLRRSLHRRIRREPPSSLRGSGS